MLVNQLTSIDFLNQLPNPEKLEDFVIYNNKIQSTDIEIFSKLVNLKSLRIGTDEDSLKQGKRNKFYGSLESWKDLTELNAIDIKVTDIDKGLEYLPLSLVKATKKWISGRHTFGGYERIECSPYKTNAKCSTIQGQLKPFDYDVEAWKKANPELIIAKLEKELDQANNKISELEEQLELEQETNQESAEMMDDFYRRQFIENQTPNILKEFSEDYLKTSWENKQLKKNIEYLEKGLTIRKELENCIEISPRK